MNAGDTVFVKTSLGWLKGTTVMLAQAFCDRIQIVEA
jgi:hypothetical protein